MEYQHPNEFASLLKTYKALPRRRNVLEIGSMVGDTLRHWIEHGEPGMTIVSVDKIVPPNDHRHFIQKAGHEKDWPNFAKSYQANLTVIDGFSQHAATIAKVEGIFNNRPVLDFLFIDGGHDYATVAADWANYSPLVKPGGLVAFHDMVGISDVKRLWNEVSAGYEKTEVFSVMPGGWGIGCLTIPDKRPTLHIITPCMRPENLQKVAESLLPGTEHFQIEWWIVMDGSRELTFEDALSALKFTVVNDVDTSPRDIGIHTENTPPDVQSSAGKGQINFALDQIPVSDDWVWVLDDDNVAHPDFFKALLPFIEYKKLYDGLPKYCGVAFDQETIDGGFRQAKPENMRECGIDQAQFVVRRSLIGDDRYEMKYSGDGEFAGRMYNKAPEDWAFVNEQLTYYNRLEKHE